MAKGKGKGLSFGDMHHGKKVGAGTDMHMKHIGGKGKGGMEAQVEGHVDYARLRHDAKGHDAGSRGPFTSTGTGKHKAKD